jgi:hypothetical protein
MVVVMVQGAPVAIELSLVVVSHGMTQVEPSFHMEALENCYTDQGLTCRTIIWVLCCIAEDTPRTAVVGHTVA